MLYSRGFVLVDISVGCQTSFFGNVRKFYIDCMKNQMDDVVIKLQKATLDCFIGLFQIPGGLDECFVVHGRRVQDREMQGMEFSVRLNANEPSVVRRLPIYCAHWWTPLMSVKESKSTAACLPYSIPLEEQGMDAVSNQNGNAVLMGFMSFQGSQGWDMELIDEAFVWCLTICHLWSKAFC